MTTPSPLTWTLRLKSQKTTVLLHIQPLQTFTSIKQALHKALLETSLVDSTTGTTIPLPSSPDEIRFGRPVNVNDPSEGFKLGEWERSSEEDDDEVAEEDVKGKGKGKAKGRPKKEINEDGTELATDANILQCPKGAGLKDNAVLAFRWAGNGKEFEDADDDEGIDVDMEGDEKKKGADMWGVRIATFEDAYGVENVGDVGGSREFEG